MYSSRHARRRAYIVVPLVAATGLIGCVEKLVQTAEQGAELGQLQRQCEGSPLPQNLPGFDEELAPSGNATDDPLVGGSYAVGQGPGVAVTAKDAFRLYFNGSLILESAEPRVPNFVPLSLAPGANVLAIAVVAEAGIPAALVHLDELERDYVSDDEWKMSVSAQAEWTERDYDDSNWANATELASLGEVPGCDPESGFPMSSSAQWIGPQSGSNRTVYFRKTIRVQAAGFAQGTSGGGNVEPQVVTSFDDLVAAADSEDARVIFLPEGTYDFRRKGEEVEEIEVCPSECSNIPGKNILRVLINDEVCEDSLVASQRDDRILRIGPNKTIVGLGRGAAIRGVTFDFQEKENIIVRNVALFDINAHLLEAGDAFSLDQPKRIWIDHGSVKWVSDGFTDIRIGSEGVTLSYMHYDADEEAACDGQHRWTSEMTDAEVTVHHSRFDRASSRAPFVRGSLARVHMYNNVFSSIADWTVGASCLSQVLLEGNIFENVDAATWLGGCAETGELGLIRAPEGSNLYRGASAVHLGADGDEPRDAVFEPPYDSPIQVANDAWPDVISRAGTGGPWALPLVRD